MDEISKTISLINAQLNNQVDKINEYFNSKYGELIDKHEENRY